MRKVIAQGSGDKLMLTLFFTSDFQAVELLSPATRSHEGRYADRCPPSSAATGTGCTLQDPRNLLCQIHSL